MRHRGLRLASLLGLALLAIGPFAGTASAQQSGLTMSARVLLQGHARTGSWAAIEVDLRNDGPRVDGELRMDGGAQSNARYATPVRLETGSHQTYLLHAQPPAFARNVKVQLVANEQVLESVDVAYLVHDATQLVIGVLAERPQALVSEINLPPNPFGAAPAIVPLGDKAVLAEFSETLDVAVNVHIQRVAKAIQLRALPWVRDVVPALGSLALHFDRAKMPPGAAPLASAAALVADCLARPLPDLDEHTRTIELPVCYEGEFAPDLAEVAQRCGVSTADVARLHAGSSHRVLMVGFVPGHPYIGGLDPKLSVPRRATPRPRVVTGSIAIANAQTVVYPFTTPGGWSIIGRTPVSIFDARRDPPSLMSPGDRVRFVPISRREFDDT